MNTQIRFTVPTSTDESLDRAVAQIVTQLESGESIDLADHADGDPERLEQLEKLLPTLQAMVGLGRSLLPDSSNSAIPGTPRVPHSAISGMLGDFQIIREIGRGGMGVVFEAEQLSLNRKVALKVLPFAGLFDRRALARFQNEARAAATLEHPNIVPVYAVADDRGVHFYAMRLIRGQSLAEVIAGLRDESGELRAGPTQSAILNPQSAIETQSLAALATERSTNPKHYFRRVAELGIQAAEALAHAHETGVIHRDIKPANLLVDAAGKLFVTDFGLARLEADASMTATGDLVGTLRYMSPEQVAGSRTGIDHRTDIYSLGVTLYELATGVAAFAGQNKSDLIRRIADEAPRPPRQVRPEVPQDLETIILKAIEKDPADRYASATALADDLRSFAAHRPIAARPPSLASRAQKWARRHPSQLIAATAALAVYLIAAIAAFSVSSIERKRTAAALSEAQAERDRANEQFRRAEDERRRTENERQQAHESLKLARNVIDSLYTKLGSGWIADETAPSNFQRQILSEASEFYRRLADAPIKHSSDLGELSLAMSGHGRIGQIQHYLQNYEQAAEAHRQVIALMQKGLAVEPQHAGILSDMAYEYHKLGQSLFEVAQYDEALDAHEKGAKLATQLIDADIEPLEHRFYLARINLARAATFAVTGFLPEAADIVRAAEEELAELRKEVSDDQWYWSEIGVDRLRADYWLGKIQGHRGSLDAAQELCDTTLRLCRGQRTYHADDVRLQRLEVALVELSAELATLRGDLSFAIEKYQSALEMRGATLRAGFAPERFIMEAAFKKSTSMDGNIEPGPFCSYVETQLRLADVLRRADRPYAAEDLIGECTTVTAILVAEYPNVLRYRVADANTWAVAAKLLAERRPAEAEFLYRKAEQVWAQAI